ncbi:N-acetylneuraminate synthase family protein [Alphaproteobacteria bacterium]|nr:N-acetylneuraminate synthase family protein [Alphaproteobacteria bacterium]
MKIDGKKIDNSSPCYFIADIAANHDGSLSRAIDLIHIAAESGADAAKFQHFTAATIVSDFGFNALHEKKSHQSGWKKSVFETYDDASLNVEWCHILQQECKKAGISFFTSPYSIELVNLVDDYVPAFKIGSGDITWHEIIRHIASKNKPVILATGASNFDEVKKAINVAMPINSDLALLQCNTNYTGDIENFRFINLKVLETYKAEFPDLILGLSDHTSGHATVLGAVALGAKIVEKHLTDDTSRVGPDHAFSMDQSSWRDMVDRTRELELALGVSSKSIEENEKESVVLQRRSIRLKHNCKAGDRLNENMVEYLRPCPVDAIKPYECGEVFGKNLAISKQAGDCLYWSDIQNERTDI